MSSPCYIPQFFVGLSSLPRLVLRKGTMAASGGYPFDLSWDIAMLGVLVDPMRNQVENHLYAWLKQHLTGLTPNRQEAEISNVTCHFYIFLYLGVLYVFGSGARSTSPAYNRLAQKQQNRFVLGNGPVDSGEVSFYPDLRN